MTQEGNENFHVHIKVHYSSTENLLNTVKFQGLQIKVTNTWPFPDIFLTILF